MQDTETLKKHDDQTQESVASSQIPDNLVQSSENELNMSSMESMKNLAAALEAQLLEKTSSLDETHDKMLRIAADFENARKRWDRERSEVRQYSIQEFARDLLPVIDAFEKALIIFEETSHSDESPKNANPAMMEGIQLVSKVFYEALKKHRIERLPGKGSLFNPEFHNAIAKVIDHTLTQETVVDEYAPGYRIADRILRTGMVRVGTPD